MHYIDNNFNDFFYYKITYNTNDYQFQTSKIECILLLLAMDQLL